MDGFVADFDKLIAELAEEQQLVYDAAQSIVNMCPLGAAPAPISPDRPPLSPGKALSPGTARGTPRRRVTFAPAVATVSENAPLSPVTQVLVGAHSTFNAELVRRINSELFGHVITWMREQYATVAFMDNHDLVTLRYTNPGFTQLYDRVNMLRGAANFADMMDLFEGYPRIRDNVANDSLAYGRTVIIDYLVKYCDWPAPVAVPLLA
jgi:hypothetical protein